MTTSASTSLCRGPLLVKLETLIEPNAFWATEVPRPPSDPAEAWSFQRTTMHQVLVLEEKLANQYNNREAKIVPEGMIPDADLREDLMVAVRSDHESRFWFRGRLLGVSHSRRGPLVRVFLVDYGIFLDDVVARVNVRQLPRNMRLVRPRATQLVAAGLTPLSMHVDYHGGGGAGGKGGDAGGDRLTPMPSKEWSLKAYDVVKEVISQAKENLAEVTDYAKDARGRIHGTVRLVGTPQMMFLHELLVQRAFAVFKPGSVKADIASEDFLLPEGRISICGSREPTGAKGDSAGTSSKELTELEAKMGSLALDETQQNLDASLAAPPSTAADGGVDHYGQGIGQWICVTSRVHDNSWLAASASAAASDTASSTAISFDEVDGTAGASGGGGGGDSSAADRAVLRSRRNMDETGSVTSGDSSMWQQYRSFLAASEASLSLDTDSTVTEDDNESIVIPAGIDPGKFLEEQLKRVRNTGIGPKKVYPSSSGEDRSCDLLSPVELDIPADTGSRGADKRQEKPPEPARVRAQAAASEDGW